MNTTVLPFAFIFVIIVVFVFFVVIFRGWFLLAVSFTPLFCGLHSGEQSLICAEVLAIIANICLLLKVAV